MTPEELDKLLNNGNENEQLEFKEAKNSYDFDKLLTYCSAIANRRGGKIILGVSSKRPRKVTGTNAFLNLNKIKSEIYTNLKIDVPIEKINHPDGRVLVFEVPSRRRGHLVEHNGYWTRSGESLVKMSLDEIQMSLNESKEEWINDVLVSNLSEGEVVQKLDAHKYYELEGLDYPSDPDEVMEKLLTDKFISKNNNSYSILKLGAVLIARNLKDFSTCEFIAPRVFVYEDNTRSSLKSSYIVEKGYLLCFDDYMNYIISMLPQKEVSQVGRRFQELLVTENMIREVFANALIHRDFDVTNASPEVSIHPKCVEISNPGLPLIEFDRFINFNSARNNTLLLIMIKFKFSEYRSTGIDKVLIDVEKYEYPPIEYVRGPHSTIIRLYGKKSFDDMEFEEKIQACFQHCALQRARITHMTNHSLRARFGLPESKSDVVSRIINKAMDKNLIKQLDPDLKSRKNAKYKPYWE